MLKGFILRNRLRLACAVPVTSLALPLTAFAAEGDSAGVTGVLDKVTTLITWALGTFTSFTAWLGMFIVGFAMAALFRLLHSA